MSTDSEGTSPPYVPRTQASAGDMARWTERRARIGDRVAALAESGACYQCEELATGGVLGPQCLILDAPDVRVVLASDPRAPGHSIVVWKVHVQDFTQLDDAAVARLFTVCRDVARALQIALSGVERVYQVSMCDGPVNHLHIQLIPRYSGTPIGSQRLVDPRGPLLDGELLAARIGSALQALDRQGPEGSGTTQERSDA